MLSTAAQSGLFTEGDPGTQIHHDVADWLEGTAAQWPDTAREFVPRVPRDGFVHSPDTGLPG